MALPAPQLRIFPVWLLQGPRQVGKSSLLQRCGQDRTIVDLDNLDTRARANRDPELFFRDLEAPLLIDEIQYAPSLLSPVKRLVDKDPERSGLVWLTGSQSFEVMRGVTETLAGRVAILELLGLSDQEKGLEMTTPQEYFRRLSETTFPRLFGVTDEPTRELYLSSYLQTYIERDVRELLRVDKRREFETFVRMVALRSAQVINYDDLARDVGVSPTTVREWISLLEDSFLVRLVSPYFSNRTKRMIKSPRLYFLDAGLAAFLGGWRDPETLRLGPMAGPLFETHVLGEIVRFFRHRARDVEISFWRTRDGQEIDFLVSFAGKTHPIEVKLGRPNPRELARLEKLREPSWQRGRVVSLAGDATPAPIREDWDLVHPCALDWGA